MVNALVAAGDRKRYRIYEVLKHFQTGHNVGIQFKNRSSQLHDGIATPAFAIRNLAITIECRVTLQLDTLSTSQRYALLRWINSL